jgi:murein DD-endopeptidase MepM/ murein hydrolase activator NlpD
MMAGRVMSVVLATICLAYGVASAAQPAKGAGAQATKVLQGEIVELEVSGAGLTAVEGRLDAERVYFYPTETGLYTALVGVDMEAKPGLTKVTVKGTTQSGTQRETQFLLMVKTKVFKKESFSVAPEFDQLSAATLEKIRWEQKEFARAFATSSAQRFWESPFLAPVRQDISSPFGYRRVINGTPRAPHTGTDLRAPMGTEVIAANHGRVVLAGDFYFAGKSMVLDHGGGLHTMYFHLSEVKFDEGAEVRKGDVLALSGMTGRVTGPHLHWGARLNGTRVDPFELITKLSGQSDKTPTAKATLEILEK